ncbi:uncharacterized protein VTP21DRAFT_3275 [Calcarisporiella thermophila]|uniref:uncharacterized protein n=1 Tax=Calcarisporiella thermophila TaxID=911321 RepID=UPI003742AA2F
MEATSEDRKRRFSDDRQQAIVPPPLKKRFTLSSAPSTLPARATTNGEVSKHEDNQLEQALKWLESAQKEDVLQRMYAARHEAVLYEKQLEDTERAQEEAEGGIGAVHIYWDQLLDDLQMLVRRVASDSRILSLLPTDTKITPVGDGVVALLAGMQVEDASVLEAVLKKKGENTKQLASCLLNLIGEWMEQREKCLEELKEERISPTKDGKLYQKLKEEYDHLNTLYTRHKDALDNLKARCDELAPEIDKLDDQLKNTKDHVVQILDALTDADTELCRAEKRVDRAQFAALKAPVDPTTPASSALTPGATTATTNAIQKEEPADDPMKVEEPSPLPPDNPPSFASDRLQTLDALLSERVGLKQELDRLRMQLVATPEERIRESGVFRSLQGMYDRIRSRAEELKERVLRVLRECGEIQRERREYLGEMESKKGEREEVLGNELAKLEATVAEVREERNGIRYRVDEWNTREEGKRNDVGRLKKIIKEQEERINSFEFQVNRLKTKLAAEAGDRRLFEYYLRAKDRIDVFEERKKQAESRFSDLDADMKDMAHDDPTEAEVIATETAAFQLSHKIEQFEAKLREYEDMYGVRSEQASEGVDGLLKAVLKEREEKLKELEERVEAQKVMEGQLVGEIENIERAFSALEEEARQQQKELDERDSQQGALLTEKVRCERKFNLLNRQRDTLANLKMAFDRQNMKQLEVIGRLQEREKNLAAQLEAARKEIAAGVMALEIGAARLDTGGENEELQRQLTSNEARLAELFSLLGEKTHQLEAEGHARRRAEEEAAVLKLKVERLPLVLGSDDELEKQCREYLELLQCPVCKSEFKSHLLSRCLHTFCRGCLDGALRKGGREASGRCPKCDAEFLERDIKQFYL